MVNLDPLVAATAYDNMVHDPSDGSVSYSYNRFKKTLAQQWLALNVVVNFFPFYSGGVEPYANSAAMREDVNLHQHLFVLMTDRAGLPTDHPMLEQLPVGLKLNGFEIWNDVFRGVHDIMGHVRTGSGFGPKGEEKAWLSHRETMPLGAHLALWCETRGQNAWTNFFGDHQSLALKDRPFGEQKSGVVSLDLV